MHNYICCTTQPSDWDIIAFQEPWINTFSNSRGSQYWRVIYPANFYVEGCSHIRSILLINTNISTDSYSILLIMNSDVTAVRFCSDNGYMSIFNIYNEITNNDTITCLDQYLGRNLLHVHSMETDHILWLGDFNRHHPIWEDKVNHLYELEEYISPLINCLYKYDMVLTLPKGILTYQICTGNWTQPDGVWCTSSTDDPIIHCDILPAICPLAADHLPVVTIINLPLP